MITQAATLSLESNLNRKGRQERQDFLKTFAYLAFLAVKSLSAFSGSNLS